MRCLGERSAFDLADEITIQIYFPSNLMTLTPGERILEF
jgi:hypothetical protein